MEVIENKRFIYEFGKFVLNPYEKTLYSDGSAIHLPAKEFETLLLLVKNNGRAMAKDEMMSAIWHDAFVEESNLAKQISRLRKILNADGDELIKTIPKHGYRFFAELRQIESAVEAPIILEKRTVKRLTIDYESQPDSLALPPADRSVFSWRLGVVLAAAAFLAVGSAFWILKAAITKPQIKTIAVLPLRPLNGDEDGKALGLGLTDALITRLGSLNRVVIRPTNAVSSFSANADASEFGRKLNVDAVFEGTIQQADGHLRINARLLRSETGQQIWADHFDEPAGGIFALQDALSLSIARALAFELNKADSDQLGHRSTQNAEAYEKYLRGRFYQSQNTPEGFEKSIGFFQQAAALDPNFADAYAGIADAHVLMFNFGVHPAKDTIPQAREAVNRALRLDPNLPDVYTSNALIQFLVDHNWPEAEKSLVHAIDLDPNSSDAFLRYGYFLICVGRFDEALEKLAKAREINPLSPIVGANEGLAYLCARRYPHAIERLERTVSENPKFAFPRWLLGSSYEAAGDKDKAFETNVSALELENGHDLADRLRQMRDKEGTDAANRFWLDDSIKRQPTGDGEISPLVIAMRAATVKDREQTLVWLEKAIDEDDTTIGGVKYLAKFDFVRDDPRFQAMATRMPY
ncbi:MAG: winged helix-turn-helix domain-containing protein [Acidobacteriota bacterium]